MHNEEVRIWIASPSYLLRKSLVMLLRQNGRNFRIQETGERNLPQEVIIRFDPDIFIIDAGFFAAFQTQTARQQLSFLKPETRICGLLRNGVDDHKSALFDNVIFEYDSSEEIWKKTEFLLARVEAEDIKSQSEELTDREKEVLIELVKGFTNKEIGENLNLSVHTVITHRKNITRKLDIKSSSGLTIYAIMNQLISIDEVKER
ncbi:MAG: response regulator transcription factor [Bacteroidales bacterium]